MNEIWKDVVGYEGIYKVSNFGNVMSLSDRFIDKRSSDKDYCRKNVLGLNGYFKVVLSKNNKQKEKLVHRIVAEAFIPNPDNKPQVNHIDGNKLNNNVNNLEWCTVSENRIHAFKTGLQKGYSGYGDKNHRSKKVKQIFKDGTFKVWDSMMSAERYGYSTSQICRCCKGQNKTHKGTEWEYTDEEPTEKTFFKKSTKAKTELFKRECKYCGVFFETENARQIACSRKCAKKHYDKKYREK